MVNVRNELIGAPLPEASPSEPSAVAFPIVGIGGSAGGLEAFMQFLEPLPSTTGMAYVFVQHLDPAHSSILPDLLAQVTKMPLCAAQDQMAVKVDHVYVIPSNADLALTQGILYLLPRTQLNGQHLPIDRFFQSLAQDRGSEAIGVLLSGTATDGTIGLQAIKSQGGMTFAQNAQSAKYAQMPQHAIAAGWVDRILSPEEIARSLITLSQHGSLMPTLSTETPALTSAEQQAFTRIRLMLGHATNVDFLAYRPATLQRRIIHRMAAVQIAQFSTYATYLDDHPAEMATLSQEVLIHVTRFFRDPSAFEAMARLVFPELLRQLLPGDTLRIWVAGCSTGEEVYSLAICLLEFLEGQGLTLPFQLFATDIDAAAIQQARAGIYLKKNMLEVSPQRLQRFFLPVDRGGERYQISKAIREQCVFARQNVANDPPFSRLDLVSCRNVLIYLTPLGQEKVLQTLHYALKPHGFLLLGASEHVGPDSALFAQVEHAQKIFRKKSWGHNPVLSRIKDGDKPTSSSRKESSRQGTEEVIRPFDIQQEVNRLLLSTYAPACVVIDNEMQILQIRGRISPYLEPASGKASLHLLSWAHDGLKLGLRAAIHRAQKEARSITREGLQVIGMSQTVQITVAPLKGSMPSCFLVVFEDGPPLVPAPGGWASRSAAARIAALEQELAMTRTEVQTILEEHDRASEHQQAANEESRSSNEELQSLNEELETSQAELQAINEELTTVNQELQTRNEQLRVAQDYAESIIETIREPLVVLNADVRVQRANTAFYKFFQVTPPEIEQRILFDLGNRQWDLPQLRTQLEEVQSTNHSFHAFEVEHHFPGIGHKIMLLNARRIVHEREGTRNHLILLAMEDITVRRELERQKETFLAMVSHELKTPLTSAKGFVQILQRRVRKTGDEHMATVLGTVDGQLDKLAHLIGGLLDASALETGKFSIRPAAFALDDLVREVVAGYEHISPGRIHIEDSVQAEAYADRERTGQVLLNLLINGLKYSAPIAPVWVSTSISDDKILLSVRDLGIGIPQDQQEKIFERFARLDRPEQVQVSGAGLGLYIATQIVTRQGGRIWVESSTGAGTTFFFTIPLAPIN